MQDSWEQAKKRAHDAVEAAFAQGPAPPAAATDHQLQQPLIEQNQTPKPQSQPSSIPRQAADERPSPQGQTTPAPPSSGGPPPSQQGQPLRPASTTASPPSGGFPAQQAPPPSPPQINPPPLPPMPPPVTDFVRRRDIFFSQ